MNIDTVRKAQMLINDRPVIAQCIGPFSLAGRLMNVNEVMMHCFDEPEMVHVILRKATDFIISYAKALKNIGANGIMLAEPLAGILSPPLIKEFSTSYVYEVVSAIQDKNFIVIYHNCGNSVPYLLDAIMDTGCFAFHFGDAIDIRSILEKVPRNYLVMGNISPSKVFKTKTPDQVRHETLKLLNQCGMFNNFVISSGCDLPPDVDLDNVEEFFKTSEGFYYRQSLWNAIS